MIEDMDDAMKVLKVWLRSSKGGGGDSSAGVFRVPRLAVVGRGEREGEHGCGGSSAASSEGEPCGVKIAGDGTECDTRKSTGIDVVYPPKTGHAFEWH